MNNEERDEIMDAVSKIITDPKNVLWYTPAHRDAILECDRRARVLDELEEWLKYENKQCKTTPSSLIQSKIETLLNPTPPKPKDKFERLVDFLRCYGYCLGLSLGEIDTETILAEIRRLREEPE